MFFGVFWPNSPTTLCRFPATASTRRTWQPSSCAIGSLFLADSASNVQPTALKTAGSLRLFVMSDRDIARRMHQSGKAEEKYHTADILPATVIDAEAENVNGQENGARSRT